jgi:DNA-binding SARP family transcriptional activator
MGEETATVPVLRLGLFGGFRAALDAAPVPDSAWERPAARRLVKLLAVEPPHRLHRDQVLDQLWPDLAPDAAVNTLRKALHQARRAVEPEARRASATYFQFQDETLSLSASVWIDIDAFESLAAHALRSHARPQLEEALAAYGGALLPEDQYEDWVLRRREELDRTQRLLLHDYAASLTGAGEHDRAIAQLRRSLAIDPLQQ